MIDQATEKDRKTEKETYECHVQFEVLVNGSPEDAYDAFGSVVWWGGGGLGTPGVVERGDPRTLEGSVRCVPLGIHESAVRTSYPNYFEYTLTKKSIFPVSSHLGQVSFKPAREDQTLILWNVYYTPLPCLNWLARLMMSFLPFFLQSLKTSMESNEQTGDLCRQKPKGD